MAVDWKILEDILRTPGGGQRVKATMDAIVADDGRRYDIIKGRPVMLDMASEYVTRGQIQEYYNDEAKVYNITHGSALAGTEYNIRRHYLSMFEKYVQGRGRTLEFGAGTGRFSRIFKEMVSQLVVSDLSLQMLLQNPDEDLPQICADTQVLPFADKSFDLCIGCFTLAYAPDKAAALEELRRILRPDGRLVLLDMQRTSPIFRLSSMYYYKRRQRNRPTWTEESTLANYTKLLRDAGFTIEEARVFSWIPHALPAWIVAMISWLDTLLPFIPGLRNHPMRLFVSGVRNDEQ